MIRTRLVAPLVVVLAVVSLALAPSAWAWWSDTGKATSTVTATTLQNPVALGTSSNCTANNSLLGSTITFKWTGVTPLASPAPQLANYEYELRFINRSNGSLVGTATVAHSGAAGTQQSYQNGASTLANLLGLNLLSQNNMTVQIHTHLKGTTWYGASPVSINWTVTTIASIATFTCNA
ncbi:hypothetical protein [Nocardioides nematodiphilus]|uniref:hypothetical protein n=1 Tax=Nocardioides nematodiphilus TaxID=2849669 RepID=UPI001CD92C01|nr:hypothetical protein [Nocardioides nematodiphilus]MCA1982730.1 hypothetical protein [Nocardioides nematodiphilus]